MPATDALAYSSVCWWRVFPTYIKEHIKWKTMSCSLWQSNYCPEGQARHCARGAERQNLSRTIRFREGN